MSRIQLAVLNTILIAYLTVTLAGFLFTMFRIRLPLPWILVRWSYNMMAPYQGDTDTNEELVAEGLQRGKWQPIDLKPYLPFGPGERNVRMYLRSFRSTEDELARDAYRAFAEQLLARERSHGHAWRSIRLTWEEWPRSPEGFEAMRKNPGLTRTAIVAVP